MDDPGAAEEERIGEALLRLAAQARGAGINAELALDGAIGRFVSRFERMEQTARSEGVALEAESGEQIKARWERAQGK